MMLSLDAAQALLFGALTPLDAQTLPLADAVGHRLAAPGYAAIASPRSTVSTMDGYAVPADDAATAWTVIGTAWPGEPFVGSISAGQAVRLFTGASLPSGTAHIIIQENIVRDGDTARLIADPGPAFAPRAAASDFAAGDLLVSAGHRLDARALLALGGGDVAHVSVIRQPRVALIATGSELVPVGEAAAQAHAIPNSLTPGLAALVGEWGGSIAGSALVPDHPGLIAAAARNALIDADIIVMTGGASVGERDHALSVWDSLGLQRLFAKVAMKPGKPVWVGQLDGRWVIGLPGNPTSAMVTARLFLCPMLAILGGGQAADALRWRTAPLQGTVPATGDRATLHRARHAADGSVSLLANQDSGAQAPLAAADCLLRTAAGQGALTDGAPVAVLDW
jgi:molybdopterin molybdotransferase